MKAKHLLTFLLTTLCSLPFITKAQDAAATEAKEEEKPAVTISGYLDSYYLHAFNRPKSGNLMGNPGVLGGYSAGRAFDRLTDQFALGLVQTKFAYSDKHADMVIDLTFGPNAELGNFGNQRVMAPGNYATGYYPGNSNAQSVLYGTS
ncbi:MAG TPA: outer membrane beta-barrel protein, partial [Cyclobacteriaceae bacterium]